MRDIHKLQWFVLRKNDLLCDCSDIDIHQYQTRVIEQAENRTHTHMGKDLGVESCCDRMCLAHHIYAHTVGYALNSYALARRVEFQRYCGLVYPPLPS